MLQSKTVITLALVLGMLSAIHAQDRQALIINGVPTDGYPAVGTVGELSSGDFCTGTLISPNHVLTAAHCAEAILDFGNAQSGTFTVGGRTYVTSDVRILSSYDSRIFTNDVAVLVLSETVEDVEPVQLNTEELFVGDEVIIVGFGGQGTPDEGSDGSFGQKLVGVTTIDGVSADEISWNFDNATESNPAPGDSGGPVFINTGEAVLLAGIISSGTTVNAALGDTTFSMRVDAYQDFITAAVETPVDQVPVDETPVDETPVDEAPVDEAPVDEAPVDEAPAAPQECPATPVTEPAAEVVADPTSDPASGTQPAGTPGSNDTPGGDVTETPADPADDSVAVDPAAEVQTVVDTDDDVADNEDETTEAVGGSEAETNDGACQPPPSCLSGTKKRYEHPRRQDRRPVGSHRYASRNFGGVDKATKTRQSRNNQARATSVRRLSWK